MLLVLDTCSIALAGEPSGGVTIRVNQIEGLPGTTLLIPIIKESAEQLYEGMGKELHKPKIYVPEDVSGTAADRAS